MRILALEPYYGGSHQAFLEGWIQRSRHDWTVLSLPPNKWKWRMRHSATTMSRQVSRLMADGGGWDLVFCSDMLNLAEFLGLAPPPLRQLPVLAYFHENQLAYPVQYVKEYDYHFAISNMTTALAATRVWFNSAFNRDSFLSELQSFLRRMPDNQTLDAIEDIRGKSDIRYPCIEAPAGIRNTHNPRLHILWAARWEYDKNPGCFFKAIDALRALNVDFGISVIGGHGGRVPLPIFEEAKASFAEQIENWGYAPTRADYEQILATADVAVSTADHEFFGIGMVEAAASGAYPLVPNRLAYPEVFAGHEADGRDDFLYDGQPQTLASRLADLATRHADNNLWQGDPKRGIRIAQQYLWDHHVPQWDLELEHMHL